MHYPLIVPPFVGDVDLDDSNRFSWAIAWPTQGDGFAHYYCNTIPTQNGATHALDFGSTLVRSLRAFGELVGNRRASFVMAEDVIDGAYVMLSLFMRDPQFRDQRTVIELTVKDNFDYWLGDDAVSANKLLEFLVEKAEKRRTQQREDSDSSG